MIGLLFLNPLLGAALGAGAGALRGRFTDIGISDQFMKGAAAALAPGHAALCVLVRKVTADKVGTHHRHVRRQGIAHEPFH